MKNIIFSFICFFLTVVLAQDKEISKYNEICFTMDVSTSMMGVDRPDREGTIEDIVCFIKNKIEESDLEKTCFYFVFYARDTLRYSFPPPVDKGRVVDFLDTVLDSLREKRKKDQYYFVYSYLTKAVKTSFECFQYDPKNTFQEIYFFTDNDFSMPNGIADLIGWNELDQVLKDYHLSTRNMRSFYYFPLFSEGLPKIKSIVRREGGRVYENLAKTLCEAFRYDTARVELKVVGPLKNAMSRIPVISSKSKEPFYSDSSGVCKMKFKTQIPNTVQFVLGATGYQTAYTHAFITEEKKDVILNPVMLQPAPVKIYFEVDEREVFPLEVRVKNINHPFTEEVKENYPAIHLFREDCRQDSIEIDVVTASKDTLRKFVKPLEWKNLYEIKIKKEVK